MQTNEQTSDIRLVGNVYSVFDVAETTGHFIKCGNKSQVNFQLSPYFFFDRIVTRTRWSSVSIHGETCRRRFDVLVRMSVEMKERQTTLLNPFELIPIVSYVEQ